MQGMKIQSGLVEKFDNEEKTYAFSLLEFYAVLR